MQTQAASAERPVAHKAHDRLTIISDLGRFAVFDGAGNPFASTLAQNVFNKMHESEQLPTLRRTFAMIQDLLLRRLNGQMLTTGTAAGIRHDKVSATTWLDYAHAGDSSLVIHDHTTGATTKLTRDDSFRDPATGITFAPNFLGAAGHTLEQCNTIPLPRRATLALFTDGITDDTHPRRGLQDSTLEMIMASQDTPTAKARAILGGSRINDDASVIVIEHSAVSP
ncbi:MAG TPA: SpoIIE family protein phosphatase [Candidatus Saccharimonadales bacterium]|nr:SpoIIE family protein phosphatase [Candidatus Saccharimonadales bacterium]